MITALISAVLLVGCATDKPKTKAEAKTISTAQSGRDAKKNVPPKPSLQLIGKVVSVNSVLRFVVAEFPVGEMPSLDERLSIYRQGQKVGEVKISGPQEEANIVADVTAGEVQAGDEVRRE